MRPIFNEKVVEKWNLWFVNSARYALIGWKLFDKSNFAATIYAQFMNSSHNSKIYFKTHEKKKTKKNANAGTGPKRTQ